jgi:predicted dehydrogenase|tara:strand:- start:435 stop:1235 length:801 start_codon:yes stop_codon:yes gene_type:complete
MKCLIIGYGNIGKVHAKYLTKNNIDWYWYDPDPVGPLSKRCDLNNLNCFDRIFITSPEKYHYDNYVYVRNNGYKGKIFVEKPVALKKGHVDIMLADENLMVGMVERFNPTIQTLKKSIEKDKLINIDFSRCCVSEESSDVSIFEDIGIHDIDLLFHLLDLDEVIDYKVMKLNKTTVFSSSSPLCRMIWSKDTFFKERKIIVRQSNCTYIADLQEQSVIKHWHLNGHHVSESLFVEKASSIENEQKFFFSNKKLDCRKSHMLLSKLI